MTTEATEEDLTCDYCGQAVVDTLGIETWREPFGPNPDFAADVHDLRFCGEEHAGRYFLEGKLPPPTFEVRALPRTIGDRLFDGFVMVLFLTAAAFICVGIWTLVHWIWR